MEKQDLALWIVNDPEAGLRAAMEQHAPAVKGILNRILPGRPEDVEECMADVFVALWKNARRLCQRGAPVKAWLVVTARNTGINRLRRLRREAAVPLEDNTAGAAQLLGSGTQRRSKPSSARWYGAFALALDREDTHPCRKLHCHVASLPGSSAVATHWATLRDRLQPRQRAA